MLMEKKKIKWSCEFIFEPGDMTRYNFLVAIDEDKIDSKVFITSLNSVRFDCYPYQLDSIVSLIGRYPALFSVPDGYYMDYVKKSGITRDYFIKYICEKSNCCAITAVAIMYCLFLNFPDFIKEIFNKEEEEIKFDDSKK